MRKLVLITFGIMRDAFLAKKVEGKGILSLNYSYALDNGVQLSLKPSFS